MNRHLTLIAVFLALSTIGAAQAPAKTGAPRPLIAHEWGTFTSIAGEDGKAVDWLPLSGPPDLPCFVERVRLDIKGRLPGKVRMETPVLYFYTPHDVTVNVNVRFPQGVVTEWFPHALVTPASVDASSLGRPDSAGTITWTDVKVSPGAKGAFLIDGSRSHYYLARETDASPLQVSSRNEKFLFYRGVGGFEPPISATVAPDGSIVVKNPTGDAIGDLILFENRRGTMAYQVRHGVSGQITLDPPALDGEFVPPQAELEQILTAHGLYPKEAKAMVDTWRDSWFEEGTRLFYVASRKAVDAILPLEIDPIPAEVARVFVGRLELVTSTTRREVAEAFARNDPPTLGKYGRFLQPIVNRILAERPSGDRARMQASLQALYNNASGASAAPAVCQ
jgi:hypothetical protein